MKPQERTVASRPALLWGRPSETVWLYVHGLHASARAAEPLARQACRKGAQVLSFDLSDRGGLPFSQGVDEVTRVADELLSQYGKLNLAACSIGAFFSLYALAEKPVGRAIFLSPIADMPYLVGKMIVDNGLTEQELLSREVIETPTSLMRREDFLFLQNHPRPRWTVPTALLTGDHDSLQSLSVIDEFCRESGARRTVAKGCGHAFLMPRERAVERRFLRGQF